MRDINIIITSLLGEQLGPFNVPFPVTNHNRDKVFKSILEVVRQTGITDEDLAVSSLVGGGFTHTFAELITMNDYNKLNTFLQKGNFQFIRGELCLNKKSMNSEGVQRELKMLPILDDLSRGYRNLIKMPHTVFGSSNCNVNNIITDNKDDKKDKYLIVNGNRIKYLTLKDLQSKIDDLLITKASQIVIGSMNSECVVPEEIIIDALKNRDVNDIGEHKSLLHIALQNNWQKVVGYLLEERKVDINIRDDNGNTPLHLAVLGQNQEMVNYLLEKGSNINEQNTLGNTLFI